VQPATSSSIQSDSDFANKSSRTQTKRGARSQFPTTKSQFFMAPLALRLCARESSLQQHGGGGADQWMHTPVKVVSEHAIPLFCQPHSIYIYLLFCSRPHSFDANSFLLRELRGRFRCSMLFKFFCCVLDCWKIIKASGVQILIIQSCIDTAW
jgi:hypothetical protein